MENLVLSATRHLETTVSGIRLAQSQPGPTEEFAQPRLQVLPWDPDSLLSLSL